MTKTRKEHGTQTTAATAQWEQGRRIEVSPTQPQVNKWSALGEGSWLFRCRTCGCQLKCLMPSSLLLCRRYLRRGVNTQSALTVDRWWSDDARAIHTWNQAVMTGGSDGSSCNFTRSDDPIMPERPPTRLEIKCFRLVLLAYRCRCCCQLLSVFRNSQLSFVTQDWVSILYRMENWGS